MRTMRWIGLGCVLFSGSTAEAQWTRCASASSAGPPGNGASSYPVLSEDGSTVAFESLASDLVAGDTNGHYDIFVRDLRTGIVERVSVDSAGNQGNGDSLYASLSSDGRFVTFQSRSTNLVAGDTNVVQDVFVHDRSTGLTERVSLTALGAQGNKDSSGGSVSDDGRFVAFMSLASNIVTPDYTSTLDCFVRDRVAGVTLRLSEAYTGGPGNLHSYWPIVSADGHYAAFHSAASNILAGDWNGTVDVFLRDLVSGTTEFVSVSTAGVLGDYASSYPALSADGRYVAFHSIALNLDPADTNMLQDVYVRDRLSGTTTRVSLGAGGVQGDGDSGFCDISADGSFLAFESTSTNLVPGDSNSLRDVFRVERSSGAIERVSLSSGGAQADADGFAALLSADGRWVTWYSAATNLVPGDANAVSDVFLRDLQPSGFTSVCEPGSAGVTACPCANPPSAAGRGCDNSSGTGGARLEASGTAYVSEDQLVFTTSGQKPSATSIVLQGNAQVAGGAVFGQGVRCAGGLLKRLYTKAASGGAITAPDVGLGDPAVSARSAALGDPILAGQTRWYLVYYRDPIVLGGCPLASTFNATGTGAVAWSY